MLQNGNIKEYISSLLASRQMAPQVVFHKLLPPQPLKTAPTLKSLPAELIRMVKYFGITDFYSHQARAIDLVRAGNHVVVATPTASGKTLIYNVPVLERILRNPEARALYLFPLKALAQDQMKGFLKMTEGLQGDKPSAAIYDGDTTAWHRKKIRLDPPNVVLTNPEMLHLAILPHHEKWVELLSGLQVVVIDEVHTYRGVMGSHMAQVFRRLIRVCRYYGASPTFIFSSATIANPGQLAGLLTGLDVRVISKSGAPRGTRHVVLLNPAAGSAQTAILLLKAALHRGLRTIVYTQSRKLTELMAIWAGSKSGAFKHKIRAYRAGFLPEERREIEEKLSNGDILAVISTSALELGIDIGDLDLCILVGYPGSIMATWQRGGRVGRSGQESALVLVAGEDALDQYFVRNPLEFMEKEPESAVINPFNPDILKKHLPCAAAEFPLRIGEPFLSSPDMLHMCASLEKKGDLLKSEEGDRYFSRLKIPHRHVNLRGTGERFTINVGKTGKTVGEIDGFRVFKDAHPGAIYLHSGDTYLVDHLDLNARTVTVSRTNVDYYTRVRSHKNTEIMEVYEEKKLWGTRVYSGLLKVTDQVTGYEKWRIHAKKRLSIVPLSLPPQVFETEGFWVVIPDKTQTRVVSKYLHFMGGIHAMEHAFIGILPYFVMTDRNDLGGISIPLHPQLNTAAVFVYDGIPGGAGFSKQAYHQAEALLLKTLDMIRDCPCDTGCPACVHSPKCGSGNRPIDKGAALYILNQLKNDTDLFCPGIQAVRSNTPVESVQHKADSPVHYGVLDIETQLSAQEVGGWHRADKMKISCVVLYDSKENVYCEYLEHQIPDLIERLPTFDLIVGFNIKRFDYHVLSGYSDMHFNTINTLDILEKIHGHLGYRLSLDHIASATLGTKKTADGLQALKWWKQGEIRKIIDYCKIDVEITKDLYVYGKENGFLLFKNKAGHTVRIPVGW